MTRQMVLSGLGAHVALELRPGDYGQATDTAFWDELTTAWARCRASDQTPVADTVSVRLDAAGEGTDPELARSYLMVSITQKVTQALIGARRGELLMLHAGGVSHPRTGRSLVFVAPGGTGKSTLARALGREYGYLSDETIGITRAGVIHPYPKPVSLRPPAGETGPKRESGPDQLGLRPVDWQPLLHRIVLLKRPAGATGLGKEHLDTLSAIEALVSETSSLGHLPRALHMVASLLAIGGGAERWTYAEHTDLLPAAREILGAA